MLENKEMSEKKKERSKSKRKRIWRGVNTSILVFSLFAPWLSTCYGEVEVSGGMMVAGSVSAITEVFNDGTLEPLFLSVLSISFVLYLLLNSIRALNTNTLKNNMWLFNSETRNDTLGVATPLLYSTPQMTLTRHITQWLLAAYVST